MFCSRELLDRALISSSNLDICVLFIRGRGVGCPGCRGERKPSQISSSSHSSHLHPYTSILCSCCSCHWVRSFPDLGFCPPFITKTKSSHRLNIDHNDPTLFQAYDDSDVAASPITTIFRLAGFGAAVHIVNAVLLTAVLSATNACFFASSRMLMSLAKEGRAPKVFGWCNSRGVPVPALL